MTSYFQLVAAEADELTNLERRQENPLVFVFPRAQVMAAGGLSLDLRDFLLRARVLKLYRQALRTIRRAPLGSRAELRDIVRQEMEINRNCNDKQKIRFLISDGLQRLKVLDETLDMQGRG